MKILSEGVACCGSRGWRSERYTWLGRWGLLLAFILTPRDGNFFNRMWI